MRSATAEDTRERRGELGQFLTAPHVAGFMASLFGAFPGTVRLLDAGAGAGALTWAFVDRCCNRADGVVAIEATLYELDARIQPALAGTMSECERRCAEAGIRFTSTIRHADFIQEMAARLSGDLFESAPPLFDVAITNPPYRKITSDCPERRALRSVGVETSNLYTGFVALIHRLLAPGGQLVGLTPRSFCNGPYFRPFREEFLDELDLRRLHVFESRRAAFRDDGVLQENIIFHAVKGRQQAREVIVSSSSGEQADRVTEAAFPYDEIVDPRDGGRFIHIPSAASHEEAKGVMGTLGTSLASLGLTVSTGPVVDYRLKEALRAEPARGTVPLLYPCHFNGGTIHWPRPGGRKPNAILDNDETRRWLVPSGVYLLTKRFTSKEERRRVVACVFDPELVGAEWIGLENHLNYFHMGGRGMDRLLAYGLYAFLNSTVLDQYFRRFSGHTQVNATDLRTLAYPDRDRLDSMGREVRSPGLPQDEIDRIVERNLHAWK